MNDAADVVVRPPYFAATVVLLVVGIPVFLLGGALVRNFFVPGPPGTRGAVDRLFEAPPMFRPLGVLYLLVAYPFMAWRERAPIWPWLVLVAGMLLVGGPMAYWAWWQEHTRVSPYIPGPR